MSTSIERVPGSCNASDPCAEGVQHQGKAPASRGKGGRHTVGSPAPAAFSRADTVVSIDSEVVSGHAYAIPALESVSDGRRGNEYMTVVTHNPWAPVRLHRGPQSGGDNGSTRRHVRR